MVHSSHINLVAYLTDYVNEELERGAKEVTSEMLFNAIEAFEGGAHDSECYAVRVHKLTAHGVSM